MNRVLIIMAALAVALMPAAQAASNQGPTRATVPVGSVSPASGSHNRVASSACTPSSVQQTLGVDYAPAGTGPGATTNGHKENFYVPQGPGCTNMPAIIYSEGSAWSSDNGRSFSSALRDRGTAAGYVMVGMSVRSHSQIKFPGQWCDIKAGIRFVRHNAATYNIDPNRIAIMGFSSGGWVAAMAGTTGDVQAPATARSGTSFVTCDTGYAPNTVSDRVQAALPLHPPTNLLAMHTACPPGGGSPSPHPGPTDINFEDYPECANALAHDDASSPESSLIGCLNRTTGAATGIQQCPLATAKADPYLYASTDDPPFLIMHGDSDALVAYNQSAILKNALVEICHDVTLIKVLGQNHEQIYMTQPNASIGNKVWINDPTTCATTQTTYDPTIDPVRYSGTYDYAIQWLNLKMPANPTAANVQSFRAQKSGSTVVLRWRTRSEARTFGFNLYREQAGVRVKVNSRLLRATGRSSGSRYVFRDRKGARSTRYWLSVVGIDGRSIALRGPVTAQG